MQAKLKYLPILAAMLLGAGIYSLGLPGGFVFDDWPNLISNKDVQIDRLAPKELAQAWSAGRTGNWNRPLPMLTLGMNHAVSGLEPGAYKITNILIHILNGALVWVLLKLLLQAFRQLHAPTIGVRHIELVALLVAACWMLHPINVTSVLYVVQRMNSLSAMFVFSGLGWYCAGRLSQISGKSGTTSVALCFLLCLPLAALCKENGLLLIPLALTIEICIFRFRSHGSHPHRGIVCIAVVFGVLPIAALLGYSFLNPDWFLNGYAHKPFSFEERTLTQPRVVWSYLRWIVLPSPGDMGLFHDDIAVSTGFFSPVTTFGSVLGIAGLLVLAISAIIRPSILALGAAFFLIGHSIESTVYPLELAFEHRNYVPAISILLVIFYYLLYPGIANQTLRVRQIAALMFIVLVATITAQRATVWSHPELLNLEAVRKHPHSVRANVTLARSYILAAAATDDNNQRETFIQKGIPLCQKAANLSKHDIQGLFCLIILENMSGKINQTTFQNLKNRISTDKPTFSHREWINTLVKSHSEKSVALPRPVVIGIIEAALNNAKLQHNQRAEILTLASDYALNAALDVEAAIHFARLATDSAPKKAQYQLNLAKILRYSGDVDGAANALELTESLDTERTLHNAIAEEAREIEKVRKNEH